MGLVSRMSDSCAKRHCRCDTVNLIWDEKANVNWNKTKKMEDSEQSAFICHNRMILSKHQNDMCHVSHTSISEFSCKMLAICCDRQFHGFIQVVFLWLNTRWMWVWEWFVRCQRLFGCSSSFGLWLWQSFE